MKRIKDFKNEVKINDIVKDDNGYDYTVKYIGNEIFVDEHDQVYSVADIWFKEVGEIEKLSSIAGYNVICEKLNEIIECLNTLLEDK